jgi:hypothetical protein
MVSRRKLGLDMVKSPVSHLRFLLRPSSGRLGSRPPRWAPPPDSLRTYFGGSPTASASTPATQGLVRETGMGQ